MKKNIGKFIVTLAVFLVFPLIYVLNALPSGTDAVIKTALIPLCFFICYFLIQTEYYIFSAKSFVKSGAAKSSDFNHPLDIWLIAIPFCVLMVISYFIFTWDTVTLYYCILLAAAGMLFSINLSRGAKRWQLKTSFPMILGIAASALYAFLAGWAL